MTRIGPERVMQDVREHAAGTMQMTAILFLALLLSAVVFGVIALKKGERRMSLLALGLAGAVLLLQLLVLT